MVPNVSIPGIQDGGQQKCLSLFGQFVRQKCRPSDFAFVVAIPTLREKHGQIGRDPQSRLSRCRGSPQFPVSWRSMGRGFLSSGAVQSALRWCFQGTRCFHCPLNLYSLHFIYNGIIFPSLNPAKIFQFISRWTESTKSSAVGPNHLRSD